MCEDGCLLCPVSLQREGERAPEEAYLINALCPRERNGPYPPSSHSAGKENVTRPNLTPREAGRCSVAKTDSNPDTMEEGANGSGGNRRYILQHCLELVD